MAIGHGIAAVAVIGCALTKSPWYLAYLVAIGVGCGVVGSGTLAFSQALAGPRATGKWTGLQNGFANLAGVAAPALTGFLVDRTGNFLMPLAITASVLAIGAISWVFGVDRVEQVTWESEQRTRSLAGANI